MNIALFANLAVYRPLQSLTRWWVGDRSLTARTTVSPGHGGSQSASESIARYTTTTGATGLPTANRKPLRIVRVVEADQACVSVGRMVISGCMADVCAELDRLAACEAALS